MMNKRVSRSRRKMIDKVTVVALLFVVFIILPCWAGCIDTQYKMDCIVTDVRGEIITVIDKTGNLWDFCGEGFSEGESIKVTFFNNTTDSTRIDDEIINVTKKKVK